MSSTHRSPRRVGIVLVLLLALFAAACGSSDDSASKTTTTKSSGKVTAVDAPGVTDSEIHVASFGTNSNNPLGTCVLKCYDEGIKAYFAYRNDQGGIHGRKLVLSKELDDELGKNAQRANEIVSDKDVFAAFSAPTIANGWDVISKAGIPFFVRNIYVEGARENIFGDVPSTCITCTRRVDVYVAKLAKAKKIGAVGYGISPASKSCVKGLNESFTKYGDEIGGAKVVFSRDDLSFGLQNGVAPEVTAMKAAGVDLLITCIDLKGDLTFANEMERQGMGDVPMFHPNLYDHEFVKAAGKAFEGDYIATSIFRPFEASSPALDNFRKWMKKTNAELSEHAIFGWINADELYTGLKKAGPSFDRQKVIDALNTVKGYTADGLIPPIDFARQHEAPTEADPATHGSTYDCRSLLKVGAGGAFSLISPKDKPFLCWPGETRDWSEPVARTFD